MIKMFIGDEEVVCNKEITITEEMLSTSSTILDNCYPKSWEQTKDYTSNYYYPEDYSKCVIEDIAFNVDDIQILGKCEQNGTPTPTNPVPIITYTGNIIYNILGKDYNLNLGDIELCKIGEYQDRIYKNNGKWYLDKKTKKIILNGSEIWQVNVEGFTIPSAHWNSLTNNNCIDKSPLLSNYYKNYITWSDLSQQSYGIGIIYSVKNLYIRNTNISTIADFKSWLSNNPVEVYYILETPVTTEITDESLIYQLENLGRKKLFVGVVKNTGDISLNPRNPHFCSLQIIDFKTFLSEGETLDFVITNKTVEQAINMVIEAVKDYGFELGNLNIFGKDDIIGAYSTQNKSAYDVFQYLADITQSKWNTRVIDENTIAIDFYDPTLMPRADNLKYTIDYFEKNKIKDINFNYGTRDYRNKQVMLSDKVYASIDYDEIIIADGYAKTFTTQQKIGIIKQIKVNGIETTFATNTDKELGIEAEFYYTPDDTTIESTNLIGSGIIIEIIYVPLVQGRQIVYNYDEVERIRENTKRKGVIARYENRNDVQSSDELNKVGQAYLRYKGSAEINLNVLTYNKDLYKVGQIVHFEAPLPELSTDYMVKSKETQIISPGDFSEVFYTYKLVSNFNSENAINYFDNQRNKMVGNIGQGEYITRNIDIENASLIYFDNLGFSEIHTNILDCELEAPFIL